MATAQPSIARKPLHPTASIRLDSLRERDRDVASDHPRLARRQQNTKSAPDNAQTKVTEEISLPSPDLSCNIDADFAVDDPIEWNWGAEELDSDEQPTGGYAPAALKSTTGVAALVCSIEADPSSSLPADSDELELAVIGQRALRLFNGTNPPRLDTSTLPLELDKSLLSRNICISCLFLSWCTAIACITFGACITPSWHDPSWLEEYQPWARRRRNVPGYRIYPSPWGWWCALHLIPLALNVLVTICTDSLGFIQTASLRWSLQQDGVLMFNSNLRLLTSTKRNPAHRWYFNAASAFFASTCYAATPLLSAWGSYRNPESGAADGKPYWIPQGIIFIYLGTAVMGQAALATWCLKSVPTWSSNPLNTTLACLELGLQRHCGRCMMSVHHCNQSAVTKYPHSQQASAGEARHFAARIVRWLWALTWLALFWGITMAMTVELVNKYTYSHLTDLGFTPASSRTGARREMDYLWRGHGIMFAFNPPVFPEFGNNVRNTIHICALMLVQSPLVFGLHCLEQLVNMSRDEAIWRRASSRDGVKHEYNAILTALRSPQTILLFFGKAATHWIIGQSFNVKASFIVTVRTAPIFVLTAALALLAHFGSRLANDRSDGPQPATFGHIQTLADLIDDWSETMYWGDKGVIPGSDIRHAGTLHKPLKPPQSGAMYGGNCCSARREAYNEL